MTELSESGDKPLDGNDGGIVSDARRSDRSVIVGVSVGVVGGVPLETCETVGAEPGMASFKGDDETR